VHEEKQEQESVYNLLSREEKLKTGVNEELLIDLFDQLLLEAICHSASDIHIQPEDDSVIVRYRIDGVLYDQETLSHDDANLIISRLKVLSHLDIAQRRIPQDGKFKVILNQDGDKKSLIDLRISTFPTTCGEKVVVRILGASVRNLSLNLLGLSDLIREGLHTLAKKQQGFVLVTGPTGSGKTTTLYALIAALNDGEKNIVTIEDPVEYEIPGITQSQVNEKAGFTFENGLRSILRQDPDVILIGEVRDKATTCIAIQSALTGHLVLSTLHTNDAPSAVMRLLEMGIESFLVSATLSGVLAQRLVRRLCDGCKKEERPAQAVIERAADSGVKLTRAFVPEGCSNCHNRGYKGRIGIFELLVVDEKTSALISEKADASTIKKQAMASGFKTLSCDGFEKVEAGITSLDEIFYSTLLSK